MKETPLSSRENEILGMAATGYTDQAIANQLGISLATVGTYWGRVRIKMGPLSRPELVAHFVRACSADTLNALRDENEELQSSIRNHLEHERELTNALQTIRDLVLQAPDAVIFVDQDGIILEANSAASDLFGCPVSQFKGLRVGTFIPDALHEIHREHRARFFQSPERMQMGDHSGVPIRRLDGSDTWASATLSKATTPSGDIAIVFMREVGR